MSIIRQRPDDSLRSIHITRHFTKYAQGSVLIAFGDTKAICTASVEDTVPLHKRNSGEGWVTAEYSMLPSATHNRKKREVNSGKLSGRTQEIQRLIGRSLRSIVDLKVLGERTIVIDCDVLQADGGTRTASITGAFIALQDAVSHLVKKDILNKSPIKDYVAAVSVGLVKGKALLDLDYIEDSQADTDMNVVMTGGGQYVEIQATAEGETFNQTEMNTLLALANKGIKQLIEKQKAVLHHDSI